MDYGIQAHAKTQYINQQQAVSTYPQDAAAPASASETIIARLNGLRAGLAENRSSADHAAEKIVGSAPTPIAGAGGTAVRDDHPKACCFIDALQQLIGDIEDIARDTAEHLNRLHRSF